SVSVRRRALELFTRSAYARSNTRERTMRIARVGTRQNVCTLIVVVTTCVLSCAHSEPERPVPEAAARRVTRSGAVVGFVSRYGSHAWLGIPYAKPPVGALRWRAPQPPAAWTGTREAVTLGSPCTQFASPLGGVNTARAGTPVGSEDCL